MEARLWFPTHGTTPGSSGAIRDVAHTGGVPATLCSNCTRNLVVYEKCAYDMVHLYRSMRVVAYIVTIPGTIPIWTTILEPNLRVKGPLSTYVTITSRYIKYYMNDMTRYI